MTEQGTTQPMRVHVCLLRAAEIQELRAAMAQRPDGEIVLAGLSTDGADAAAHVAASQPDVVIVGSELFTKGGGNGLLAFLTDLHALGQRTLVLIEVWDEETSEDLRRMPAVEDIHLRPVDASEVVARAWAIGRAVRAARRRARQHESAAAERLAERMAVPPAGRSIVCLTARKGGIGKDTLASNLAWAVPSATCPSC